MTVHCRKHQHKYYSDKTERNEKQKKGNKYFSEHFPCECVQTKPVCNGVVQHQQQSGCRDSD